MRVLEAVSTELAVIVAVIEGMEDGSITLLLSDWTELALSYTELALALALALAVISGIEDDSTILLLSD
jgi:hypothetical protein